MPVCMRASHDSERRRGKLYSHNAKPMKARIQKVKELYDEKFCRMWDFNLSRSQASFEESTLVVFQLQLSKNKKTVPDKRDYLLAKLLYKSNYAIFII